MIFKAELADKILAGEKTVTRRLVNRTDPRSPWWIERCAYVEGKVFTVNPGRGVLRVCEARVTRSERVELGVLSVAEARLEGFATAPEFESAFAGINGKYDPSLLVWRIEFEVIGEGMMPSPSTGSEAETPTAAT